MLRLDERLKTPVSQWDRALRQLSNRIRVAIPGIVQSFDAEKQTVSVQPVINELVYADWQEGPVHQQIPLLADVPVILPRAGGFTLTVPVQQGDECLVVFVDMDISAWWQSGGTENNQVLLRRHDLSDGFAILGCWSQPRVLQNYSTTAAQLRSNDGNTVVEVGSGEVTVKAQNVTVTGSNNVTISGNGHTTIEGRDFLHHTHSGVAAGSSTSGPVV